MNRQQLAQRIHLLLEREIDHLVLVERLLSDAHYARDVLLVCDALTGTTLPELAALFREASPATDPPAGRAPGALAPEPAAVHGGARASTQARSPTTTPRRGHAVPGHAAQANAWGQDTSGFGLSQPAPLADPAAQAFGDRLAPPVARRPGAGAAAGTATGMVTGNATGSATATAPGPAAEPAPERRRNWLDRLRGL